MPNTFEGTLANIPGYGGYLAKRKYDEESQLNQLQQAGGAMKLMDMLQSQADLQKFRQAQGGLPTDATPEQQMQAATPYVSPETAFKGFQTQSEKQAALAANKEAIAGRLQLASQTLEMKQQDLDRKREEFTQRTTDQNAKAAFEQWYKGETLRNKSQQDMILNEFKKQGLDIQQQGLELKEKLVGQGKTSTEGEKLSSGYASRMDNSENIMSGLTNEITGKPSITEATLASLPFVGEVSANAIRSPKRQMYRQAQEDWVRAKLRKESGATIPEPEMDREIRVYFPQIGDSDEVIKQKEESRQVARKAMKLAAGRAYQPATHLQSDYIEIRTTKDGKRLGKKADGTIEEIK